MLQHLFDYCVGNAEEDEEINHTGSMALVQNFPTKRHEDCTLTLKEAGLESNMILRVVSD
jgi:hypothetical protein